MNKKILQIVLLLVLYLAFFELAIRIVDDELSLDTIHYGQIDEILNELSEPSEHNILFLGNSLTRHGIDEKVISDVYSDAIITKVYPDDTTIIEWYWIFFTKIISVKPDVDILVILFAPGQLRDRVLTNEKLIRIAKLIDIEDLSLVQKREDLGVGSFTELFLGHISKLYASHEKIQRRLLNYLPYYRSTVQQINTAMKKEAGQINHTYNHLRDLISQEIYPEMKFIFVAVPLPDSYVIETDLLQVFKNYNNVSFVDGNLTPGLTIDDFLDGYHLNDLGSKKFSHYIGVELKSIHNCCMNVSRSPSIGLK